MSDAKPETTPQPDPASAAPATQQTLAIDWSTEPCPAYANGAHVAHTPREFALIFTDNIPIPGRLASDGQAGHERAAVVASIRMTPDVFFQMMCVFASNWNRFANELIDPRMRKPRFKLLDAGDVQLDGVPQTRE